MALLCAKGEQKMNTVIANIEEKEIVKQMVARFLRWRLPEDFSPDAGISFKAEYNENTPYPMRHEPVGTNLFDAEQAEQMVRHMLGLNA